jgi:putative ABC transport system permease protein
MDSLLQDLRYAVRMVVKSPGITAIAFLTIGVATGANATVYGFVSALLLRPAPGVVNPGSLVSIYTSDYSSGPYGDSSYPDFVSLQSEASTFTRMAAQQVNPAGVIQIGDRIERAAVAAVTAGYFELLGVKAAHGRLPSASDAEPSTPPVVAIGYRLWSRTLAADPSILNATLTSNGRAYTIVGIVAEGFDGLDLVGAVQVWMPFQAPPETPDERGNRGVSIVARLREGVPRQEAQTQVSGLAARLARAFPATNLGTLQAPTEPRPMFVLPHTRLPPDFRPTIQALGAVLMGAVVLVLVIACANVAGLLVSRAISRDREMAVRLALGAGRITIVRLQLTESVVLGIGGGLCGLLLSLWSSDVLPSFFPAEQAQLLDTSVDARIVLFIGAISLASSLLFGLAPALHASGAVSALSLRSAMNRAADSRSGTRLRRLLVSGQVAVAVVLLVSSGLLVRSLVNALDADLGFGTRDGVVATAELPDNIRAGQGLQYYSSVLERVRGLSGVRGAALVGNLPLSQSSRQLFQVDGYQPKPNEDMELVINVASDGYFETMQIPLRAGRAFDSRDRADSAPVVIVNDLLAARFFGGDAVGKALMDFGGRRLDIVGVVGSHKYLSIQQPPVPTVFFPLEQEYRPRMTLVARVDGATLGMIEPIRRVMTDVSPRIPVFRTISLSSHLDEAIAADRLTTSLVAVCGAMALLLATLGVYGVIAYAVVRRSREIGIRIALGARPLDVIRLILAEGMSVTGVGLVLGLVAAAAAARAVGSLMPLHDVHPNDPLTYLLVPALLGGVACAAALAPARRAIRLDPNVVLRHE